MHARTATWLTVLALTCSTSRVAAQRSTPAALPGASSGGGSPSAPATPSTAPATPSDDEARVHFRLGTAYYDSGRFAQAAEEFKQAHELSQRPQLLYNLFLAYRDAGDLVHAAEALRQFLVEAPDVEERDKLEARLASIDKMIAEGKGQQAVQPPGSGQPAAGETAKTASDSKAAPAADEAPLKWLPWTLIGAGGALIVGGVVSGALAASDENKLEKQCGNAATCTLDPSEVSDLRSSGSAKAVTSDALWISGAVVAGLGVTFLFWQPWKRASEAPSTKLNVGCGTTGCRAVYTGRF